MTAASLEERLAPCLACHGAQGQSVQPECPRSGRSRRSMSWCNSTCSAKLRTVEIMNAVTQGLTDDDLRSMADVAKLPPPRPVEAPGDPARLERARALIQQHRCNFCHNPDFSGAQQCRGWLASEDYLVKALREYKNNTRRGYDPAMAEVLYELSDESSIWLIFGALSPERIAKGSRQRSSTL